jgi:hypothetical protein
VDATLRYRIVDPDDLLRDLVPAVSFLLGKPVACFERSQHVNGKRLIRLSERVSSLFANLSEVFLRREVVPFDDSFGRGFRRLEASSNGF